MYEIRQAGWGELYPCNDEESELCRARTGDLCPVKAAL